MCRGKFRQLGRRGGRTLFPETLPPLLNHAVLTGKVLSEPREGRGPSDDPVTLLEVEFPVAHPEHPRFLWTHATYDVLLRARRRIPARDCGRREPGAGPASGGCASHWGRRIDVAPRPLALRAAPSGLQESAGAPRVLPLGVGVARPSA